MAGRWREACLDDDAWRPPVGMSQAQRMREQDHAAGGREKRRMQLASGRVAHASVYFRRPQGRRVYAYLRWADAGRTRERCVGEITRATREANLTHAWRMVAERRLLTLTEPSDPAA